MPRFSLIQCNSLYNDCFPQNLRPSWKSSSYQSKMTSDDEISVRVQDWTRFEFLRLWAIKITRWINGWYWMYQIHSFFIHIYSSHRSEFTWSCSILALPSLFANVQNRCKRQNRQQLCFFSQAFPISDNATYNFHYVF